jgi:hypothetical protein
MGATDKQRRRSPLPQCENGAENARSAKVMQPVRPPVGDNSIDPLALRGQALGGGAKPAPGPSC